jgi:GT2 family glycosyltransferase
MSRLGIVAIARNEGERLRRCLASLAASGAPVVYVDSGSTDGSVDLARSRGVEVVELDLSRPFTAARSRNAGFERLLELNPGLEFVQFLDGDCEIADGWLERAVEALDARPEAAVVFGLRHERFPDRSLYNRLTDYEWNMPIGAPGAGGEPNSCGGDSVFRVAAFREAGGFDPTVASCEEPELCQRLRRAGWSIVRLDADMTWHDADMMRFGQWAKRQVRTGHGTLLHSFRFGRPGDDPYRKTVRIAWVWVFGWPLAVAVAAGLGALVSPAVAGIAGGVVALAPAVQAVRIAARHRRHLRPFSTALAYGALTVLAKWYHVAGQLLGLRDLAHGSRTRLIEYKDAGAAATEGRMADG